MTIKTLRKRWVLRVLKISVERCFNNERQTVPHVRANNGKCPITSGF